MPIKMRSQGVSHYRRPSGSTARSTQTKYSVDVNALRGPDSDVSSLPDLPQNTQLDVINSEDIDGPTDFTQNMEFWMRAPLVARVRAEMNVTEPVKLKDGGMVEDIEEYIESEEQDEALELQASRRNSAAEMSKSSTLPDINRTAKKHDGSIHESFSSLESQEKVLSYLETLPDAGIPSIRVNSPVELLATHRECTKSRSLQPTVEDDESTPAPMKASSEVPPLGSEQTMPSDIVSVLKEQSLQIVRLQEELKKLRSQSSSRINELESLLSIAQRESDAPRAENDSHARVIRTLEEDQKAHSQQQDGESASGFKMEASALALKEAHKILMEETKDLKSELAGSRSLLREVHSTHKEALQSLQSQLATAQAQLSTHGANAALLEQTRADYENKLSKQKTDYEAKIVSFQERMATMHVHLEEARAQLQSQLQSHRAEHEAELSRERNILNAKIEELEDEITNLHDKVLDEKDEESSMISLATTEFRSNVDRNMGVSSSLGELEERLSAVQDQLKDAQEIISAKEREIASIKQQRVHVDELYSLSQTKVADLENGMSGLRQQLDQAHNELLEARQEATQARNSSRMANNEVEEYRSEMRLQARDSDAEIRRLRVEKEEMETKLRELKQQSMAMEEDSRIQIEKMRSKTEDAVRKIGVLLQSEKRDKLRTRKELQKLKEELQVKVEESPDQTLAHPAAKGELESIKKAAQIANANAETAKLENQALREDYESINQAMDERIVQLIKERERKWSERVEALVKDNTTLKRALLHEWGREECGLGVPQVYRYRYLKR